MNQFKPVVASVPMKSVEPIAYKLVPMDRELIPQIAQLERLSFSLPWTEEMLLEELESMTGSVIVAVDKDRNVLGYASITVVLDEGYINNIAVQRKYRRMGLGSDLLGVFIRFAEAQKLSFLTLEVRDTNLAARSLYSKFGFREVGRRKNYDAQPRADAILMTRFFKEEQV